MCFLYILVRVFTIGPRWFNLRSSHIKASKMLNIQQHFKVRIKGKGNNPEKKPRLSLYAVVAIYEVHAISFQHFFVWAIKFVADS